MVSELKIATITENRIGWPVTVSANYLRIRSSSTRAANEAKDERSTKAYNHYLQVHG